MFLLPGGHVQVDTLDPRVSHLLRIPVAVVGASRLGLGPHILLHLLQHRHQLLLVVALLRHLRRHDHLRFSIHRDLRVVALHEAALVAPIGHDPALRVGEVALRFRVRPRLLRIGYLRLTSAHLLARAGGLLPALFDLGFGGGFLFLGLLFGFGFQLRLRRPNLRQPALPPRQLDVSMIIPHQATARVLKRIADVLNVPFSRMQTNLESYANTAGATVPLLLDQVNRRGLLREGDLLLLVSIGAGWTWGASLYRW